MAQALYDRDIQDFNAGNDAVFTELAIVHEPDDSPTGQGSDSPYVGVFFQVDPSSSAALTLGNYGRLRILAQYTDGTLSQLTSDDAPFSTYANIPAAGTWVKVRADGKCYAQGAKPTAATVLAQNSNANARERIGLDSSKTLERVRYRWTRD